MKILGYMTTYNDGDVLDEALQAMLSQTRPLDEILIVDTGSTDGTRERSFPPQVSLICSSSNIGVCGAIDFGMRYAMEHGYDWVWIMDGDSAPYPDALEKLLDLWESQPEDVRAQTWRLSNLPLEKPSAAVTSFSISLAVARGKSEPQPHHGHVFTGRGYTQVVPDKDCRYYECDATIWAGSLFKLDAIRVVGGPCVDYVQDIGEYEHSFRAKRRGYRSFMHQESFVLHNIRGRPSFGFTPYRVGPLRFQLIDMAPMRCYYIIRNLFHFWVYEFRPRSLRTILGILFKLSALTVNFLIRPRSRRAEMLACLRGFWDGIRNNMAHRY